jgi:RNA polymerase sigma-70 factor (ECF subfamily)
LARTGEHAAADQAYERAIGLEADPAVRDFLQQRRVALHRPVFRSPDEGA